MNTPKPRRSRWLVVVIVLFLVLLLAAWGLFFLRDRWLPGSGSSVPFSGSISGASAAPGGGGEITQVYTLPLGAGRTVALDRDGNLLLEAEGIEVLNDSASGLPRFLAATTYRAADPYPILTTSALYALDGTLLQEAQPVKYKPGVGNTVFRAPLSAEGQTDLAPAILIDAYTGDVAREDIAFISNVGPNMAATISFEGVLTALVDENLQVIHEFSQSQYIRLVYLGGLYAGYTSVGSMDGSGPPPAGYLLDENFERLSDAACSDIRLAYPNENYIQLSWSSDDGMTTAGALWDIKTKTQVAEWEDGQSFYYCTGQVMCFFDNQLGRETLVDMDGNVLGEYDRVVTTDFTYQGGESGPLFAQAGDIFYRLAEDGSVEAEAQLPGLRMMNPIAPGLFSADDSSEQGVVLYNQDFEVLVPAGQYLSLTPYYVDGTPYIQAQHNPSDPTMSLLGVDGGTLLEGYILLGGATGDRLLVDWQGHRGMIDLQGNWLYQTDIPADAAY